MEADREELVRADGEIPEGAAGPVDAIDETSRSLERSGKDSQKGRSAEVRALRIPLLGSVLSDRACEIPHRRERVEPQCLDLDRLALPGRDGPAVDSRVHPREGLAGRMPFEEAVGVHPDAVARPAHVPRDDVREDRVERLAQERDVARRLDVRARGLEVPQSRVDRVVLRLLARVREAVRQHALAHVPGKRAKDLPRDLRAARREREARERDHRVAAPVGEPRVARDDAAPAPPSDQELVASARERAHEQVGSGVSGELRATGQLGFS